MILIGFVLGSKKVGRMNQTRSILVVLGLPIKKEKILSVKFRESTRVRQKLLDQKTFDRVPLTNYRS